ncbi:MAG: hypothetical protein Q8S33_34970 [Myxococcales bacterium]|nr:hypothetical protein [Myxococcales bacterium]MDP3505597.1 hypothetical protein [Myxococcales bacterium]
MQRVLPWAALSLWLAGLVLIVGNLTGWFPTFPYAGAAAQIVASLVTTIARAERLESSPTVQQKTSIISLVFLFALSAAGWLSVAASFTAPGSSVALRLLVSGFFTAVFIVLTSNALRAARRAQNGETSEM